MVSLGEDWGLSSGLQRSSADPMSSVANVVDCMLVFALGLMLALVAYWNMVLPDEELVQLERKDLTQVEDVMKVQGQLTASGSSYRELGLVYQDPITGKLYMLAEDAEAGEAGMAAAEGAAASGEADASGASADAETSASAEAAS